MPVGLGPQQQSVAPQTSARSDVPSGAPATVKPVSIPHAFAAEPSLAPRVAKPVLPTSPLASLTPSVDRLINEQSPLLRATTMAELTSALAAADSEIEQARREVQPDGPRLPSALDIQSTRLRWLEASKALREGKPAQAARLMHGLGLPDSSDSALTERTLQILGGSTPRATSDHWATLNRNATVLKGAAAYADLVTTLGASSIDATSVSAYYDRVRASRPGDTQALVDASQRIMAGGFVHTADVSDVQDMTLPDQDGLAALLKAPRYGGRIVGDCERLGAIRMQTLPNELRPIAFAVATAKDPSGPAGHLVSVFRDNAHDYWVASNTGVPKKVSFAELRSAVTAELENDVKSPGHVWNEFEIRLTVAKHGESATDLIARYRGQADSNVATADSWAALGKD